MSKAADSSAPSPVRLGNISGRVRRSGDTGETLGGVPVSLNTSLATLATTDNRGIFTFEQVPVGTHQLRVVDRSYSLGQASVEVMDDAITWLELVVEERVVATLPDVAQGGTLRKDQVSVTLPGGALEASTGLSISGTVEGRFVAIQLAKQHMPVPVGAPVLPLSFAGACELRFYQGDESLLLDSGATLTFPLGPNSYADDDELELRWFDEELGEWQRRGSASLVANASRYGSAKAMIDRLGWWSVGSELTDTSCLTARVRLGGLTLYATDHDTLTRLSATTSGSGEACLSVRRGATSWISGFGGDDRGIYELQQLATTDNATRICTSDDKPCATFDQSEIRILFPACTQDTVSDRDHVLVLSSGDAALDAQVRALLELGGNEVTLGPDYTSWDGSSDLASYDVVYLQANTSWSGGDMPESGQRQLIHWVNCGGGLLTVEYTLSSVGQFTNLRSILPARPDETLHRRAASTTYEQRGQDAVVHHALADSFTFTGDFFDQDGTTEADLIARSGATVYYTSSEWRDGVVGWDLHRGRVMSLSTTAGRNALADDSYRQLLQNVVQWLQRDEYPSDTP